MRAKSIKGITKSKGMWIEEIKETFNAPLVGFFTYGEFGRAVNGNNEFHNLTCCWVGLKEKERYQQ